MIYFLLGKAETPDFLSMGSACSVNPVDAAGLTRVLLMTSACKPLHGPQPLPGWGKRQAGVTTGVGFTGILHRSPGQRRLPRWPSAAFWVFSRLKIRSLGACTSPAAAASGYSPPL